MCRKSRISESFLRVFFGVFSGCFQGIFRECQGIFRVFSGCFLLMPFWVCPSDPSNHRKSLESTHHKSQLEGKVRNWSDFGGARNKLNLRWQPANLENRKSGCNPPCPLQGPESGKPGNPMFRVRKYPFSPPSWDPFKWPFSGI